MFAKISRVFIYLALAVPLVVVKYSFFPFISAKAISLRVVVELALLFFLFHVLFELGKGGASARAMLDYIQGKLKHPLVIAAAAFGVIYLFTALIGVNSTQSVWSNFERGEGAFQVLHYVIFFILAVLLFPDGKQMRRLLGWNVIVSIPICVYALAQLLINPETYNGIILAAGFRVSGTLGNPSYLAAYLLINLAIITYFFLRTKQMPLKIGLAALFLFETFILLNTGTRGALLALLAGLLVLLVINLFITKNRNLKLWLAGSLIVVVGVPMLFFATHQAPLWKNIPVFNRLINLDSAINDIKPRLWTWGGAVSGVMERPVTGWGAENFPPAFDKYYNAGHYGIESFFDRTHNIFLELLISGGLLLLIPWLAMFVIYYMRLRTRPKDLWYSVLFIFPVIYLIQGFFLFDTLPIYLVFFLFLAFFITSERERELPGAEDSYSFKPVPALTCLILAAAIGANLYLTAYLPAKKNYYLVQSLLLQNQFTAEVSANVPTLSVTPTEVFAAFDKTLSQPSPIGQEETIGMYQKFVIFVVDILSQNPNATGNPQVAAETRALVEKINAIYDNNTNLYSGIKEMFLNGGINLRFGLAFNQPDLTARGKQLYARALELSPTRLEVIRVLIEVARIEKDQATYDALIQKAKFLRPDMEWK